jgi:hypothetical protein
MPDLPERASGTSTDEQPNLGFSEPAARRLLHRRRVAYDGYAREDGLFDIEVKLLDTRSHRMAFLLGPDRPAGAPLHHMGLRVTIDSGLNIHHVEPLVARGYVAECADAALAYRQLKGLNIGRGFVSNIRTLFAGRGGCTHMTELLLPLATVAMQTIWAQQEVGWQRGGPRPDPHGTTGKRPAFADGCHAFRSDGAVMRAHWPQFCGDQATTPKTEK